jgi:hypothetical protein
MLAPYASDPLSAQQSAERAVRILAARNSLPQYPQLAGMNASAGVTPPPALTPKSWNYTSGSGSLNGSSLSAGAGQVGTKVVRGGRGKVIAAVAGLCIATGTAGFLIASSRGGHTDNSTHVVAPADQPAEVKANTVPTTAPPATEPKTDSAKMDPAKTDRAKMDPAKTDPAKTDPAKTEATTTTTTSTTAAKTDVPKSDASKSDASKSDLTNATATTATATTTAKTDTAKADATKSSSSTKATAKADTTKSDTTKTTTKSSSTKSTSKSTSHTKKSTDDDLFGGRK